jgi:undecaprenyl diphosphate synthase
MLIAYGGKDDLLHAVKSITSKAKTAASINENLIRKYLLSNTVPDIDLIIRTSGEERLSGFMPWQTSYSELYFSDKLWPEFTKKDLHSALKEYNKRQRRFGK